MTSPSGACKSKDLKCVVNRFGCARVELEMGKVSTKIMHLSPHLEVSQYDHEMVYITSCLLFHIKLETFWHLRNTIYNNIDPEAANLYFALVHRSVGCHKHVSRTARQH